MEDLSLFVSESPPKLPKDATEEQQKLRAEQMKARQRLPKQIPNRQRTKGSDRTAEENISRAESNEQRVAKELHKIKNWTKA